MVFGMDRKQALLAAVLLCAVIFGAGYKTATVREKSMIKPVVTAGPAAAEKTKSRTVTVHVTGTVQKPGVYTFTEGARVIEAVNKARPGREADLTVINLAEVMTDQQQVYVPGKGESEAGNRASGGTGPSVGSAGRGSRPGKININTADSETLDRLPGIGPSIARRIVDYRKEHGRFKSTSELLQVPGIGEKKLAEFKDSITI